MGEKKKAKKGPKTCMKLLFVPLQPNDDNNRKSENKMVITRFELTFLLLLLK